MTKINNTQVFTPPKYTNMMLDLLDQDDFAKEETIYFEPTCGNGQMLEVIVERIFNKLLEKHQYDTMKALAETCVKFMAVEIDEGLVIEARTKIFKKLMSYASKEFDNNFNYKLFSQYLIARVLQDKIVCKDFFKFMGTTKEEVVKKMKRRKR